MFCKVDQESDFTDRYRKQYSAAVSINGEEQYNCESEVHSRKAEFSAMMGDNRRCIAYLSTIYRR